MRTVQTEIGKFVLMEMGMKLGDGDREKIHGIGWGMGQFILLCHFPVDELGRFYYYSCGH